MAMYKKRPIRRKGVMRVRKTKPQPKGVSTAVAKYVRKAVARNIENKTVTEKNEISFASYFANVDLKVQKISPNSAWTTPINQGVGQGERVGNTIKTRKLLLKYVLYPMPYQATINDQNVPQEVIIWIGYLKNNRLKTPDVGDYNQFFQNGNGTTAPFSNLWDVTLPVNLDLFHICKTIRHKVGNAIVSDFNGIKQYSYYANNDFKLNCSRTIDCTGYINKTLKFDDQNTTPDTGLYMWMTAVNADGTLGNVNVASVGMFYTLRYDYEDA